MNSLIKCENIIEQIRHNITSNSIKNKKVHPFDKNQLWKIFKNEFEKMFSKEFLIDENIIKNIQPIFHYFIESEEFFKCENLQVKNAAPSFEKGLLIFGSVGVGKTNVMHVFEKIFSNYLPHRFIIIPTYKVVDEYEDISTKDDRKYFYNKYSLGTFLFDDFNSERLANNYGRVDIMRELIIRRYDEKKKTHLILNPLPNYENDIFGSLNSMDTNDQRVLDRFYSMFNVIVFKGKSLRR